MTAKIPIEHRDIIQSSYTRYSELSQLDASVNAKAEWANSAFWGGILLSVLWLLNLATGKYDSGFLAGVAFTLLIIGLATRSAALKVRQKHTTETFQIEDKMEALGVRIRTTSRGGVSVHYGKLPEGYSFNPLNNDHYA